MSRAVTDIMSNWGRHVDHVGKLVASFCDVPPGEPVRLGKRTTNLFRERGAAGARLNASELTHVIDIDPNGRTVDVEGMCTYEDLVAVTLRYGLMPSVVPQLRTITVGGAMTGLGIESTSFKAGLPHEAVLEADILCGDGVVRRTAIHDVPGQEGRENPELWRAFPNSYATLGYATRLRLRLEEVGSFVHLHHVRFSSVSDAVAAIGEICESRLWQGTAVDFVDGVVFSPTEIYVSLGRQLSLPEAQATGLTPSTYTGQRIYYRSIREQRWDLMRIDNYLWRWDTDWFWCSRAFGAQHPAVRRVWPARYRRSDVYRQLLGLDARYHLSATAAKLADRPARERLIQDIEVPLDGVGPFLSWFADNVGMSPVWLCPLRLAETTLGQVPWPLYPLEVGTTYVNVGFWGTVPIAPGSADGDVGRALEREVAALGGHKSLYSTSAYSAQEFAQLYGGAQYQAAKDAFDPQGRLGNLFDKVVTQA